jgi:hypothetical protein
MEINVEELARQVCGWRKRSDFWCKGAIWSKDESTGYSSDLMEYNTKWEPEDHIKHAWEIVTALENKGWEWTFSGDIAHKMFMAKKNDEFIAGHANTPEEAICLAAMELVEE